METNESPLRKRRRQPKLYIDLPSGGKGYMPGSLQKVQELEVYSMTASDEIGIKTPDALITGAATANVIKSCVPAIANPWNVLVTDLYTILSAIKIASYGATTETSGVCPECKETSQYEVGLQQVIDYYGTLTYDKSLTHDDIKINLRPLTYREFTEIGKATTQQSRTMMQVIQPMPESEEKSQSLQQVYDTLAEIRMETVLLSVESIELEGHTETDKAEINDFIRNAESSLFNKLEERIIKNNQTYTVPEQPVNCGSCEHEYKVSLDLDYSSFFVV